MAASAGTVTLDLDANSVKLIRELQKAQNQTKKSSRRMQGDMKRAFATMSKFALGFGVAMAAVTKKSIDAADRIAKTADAIGIPVEKFQEYEFAADRAGVASSQFASNMTAFVKRVGEAKAGMGPLVSGLKKLNPELLENIRNSRNQSEALQIVADAIRDADTATERAAIANAAFSRAGIGMVNMLRNGADGLEDTAKQARDYGAVIKESLIRDAEKAKDKLGDLQKVMGVRIASTVLENADSIITLANALITFVGVVGRATQGWNLWLAAQGIGVKSIEEIRTYGQELLKERNQLENELEGLSKIDNPLLRPAQWVIDMKEQRLDEIRVEQKKLQDMAVALQRSESPGIRFQDPEPDEEGSGILPPIDGVQDEADKISQIISDLVEQANTFGLNDNERVLFQLLDENATDAQLFKALDAIEQLEAAQAGQEESEAAQERRNQLEQEYAQIVASVTTDAERHQTMLARVKEIWESMPHTAMSYEEVVERINEQFEGTQERVDELNEFGIQAARNLQTAFAEFLFDPFDQGLDGMLKGFANMLRKMVSELLARQILMSLFGGLSGSSNSFLAGLGSAFGGGRAMGGPISAGTPYLVGERGPELVIPQSSGTVIPNHKLGGQSVVVNIDARESDDPAKLLALVPVIQANVEQSIQLKSRRGYL